MAPRKKTRTKSKKRIAAVTKKTAKKKPAKSSSSANKKSTRRRVAPKVAQRTKATKKKVASRAGKVLKKTTRKTLQPPDTLASSWRVGESPSGLESGDLQGLSNRETVDSESVDELIEDGDAYEAGIVSGVEAADDSDGEVRTHEVPEDDVPEEYLDEDQ